MKQEGESMAEKYSQTRKWTVWLLWALSNILGFALGIGLSLFTNKVVGEILSFIPFGIVVGLSQWLVLRKIIKGSGWWILATTLGATLGLAGTNVIHSALIGVNVYILAGSLGMAALGLVVGMAQWWILRGQLGKAGWWIPASAAGWFAGGIAVWALRLRLIEFVKIIADFAVLGIVIGASTGLVLILLIKEPALFEAKKSSSIRTWAIAGCSLILVIAVGVQDHLSKVPDNMAPVPDLSSVPTCSNLPSYDCGEDNIACSEVVFFEPISGPGYINYPVNDETWDDQYRSYLRRDLQLLIQYASARVACETDGWDYWPFVSVGLGDMSEEDGTIPGTSTGHPDHPMGTHQDGNDIDVAYYQRDSESTWMKLENRLQDVEGNLLRSMCKYTRFGMDVYHCTEPPRILDPWRTALFIAYVAENPYTRVIGVDGQIGPLVDDALDQLAQSGWIEDDLRERIPLVYEIENEGMGWYRFHHHHLHISLYLR
jgi:hypothetical protein